MIDRLVFSFSVVFPLFVLISLGMFLKRQKFFDSDWVAQTNRFVFRIALPASMFNSVYSARVDLLARIPALFFLLSALGVLFVFMLWFIPRVVPQPARRGVIIQGLVQSNTILLGIPLMTNLYGDAGAGELSALLALVIPFFNVVAVISFSVHGKDSASPQWGAIGKSIVTNPLIIATFAALTMTSLQLYLPLAVERSIGDIARIASPLSLLALGAGFQMGFGQNLRQLLATTFARLVLVPSIMLAAAIAFGFRGTVLAAMLIIFAAPLAVASFVMSYEYGADSEFCGQLIVFTTLGSCLTLFGFIFALSSFGFI